MREGEGSYTGDANETAAFRPEDVLTPEQMAAVQGPTREDIKRFADKRAAADKAAAEAARARIAATPPYSPEFAGAFQPVNLDGGADTTRPMSPAEVGDVQAESWMAGGDAESVRAAEQTGPVKTKGGWRALAGQLRSFFRRE